MTGSVVGGSVVTGLVVSGVVAAESAPGGGVAARSSSNSLSRAFWARAVSMPVPHNWYATKPNMSRPAAIRVLPRPPTHHRQSWGGGGRSNLRTRVRFELGSGSFSSSATSDTPTTLAVRPRCAIAVVELFLPSVAAMSTPVVELEEAVAVLGSFPALAGASIRIDEGDIVLLRGPNGAGKTTLLRVCAGLVPIVRGSGHVLGLDLTVDRDAIRRHVGVLGHQNGLYLDLTVGENIRFWGATVGAGSDETQAAMVRLGVGERLVDVPVRKLSAGQKRRTALACLVARRAQLWLLDEPHAGLDASARDELDHTLRQASASGATIVVASHELERAGSLATRTVDVIAGRVHEAAP